MKRVKMNLANQLKLLFCAVFAVLQSLACVASESVKVEPSPIDEPSPTVKASLAAQGMTELKKGDLMAALALLEKADKNGEIEGTAALAELYHTSLEFELAYPLYQKCSQAKIFKCQMQQLWYQETGEGGVTIDFKSALNSLLDLVGQNHEKAKLYYIHVLEKGRLGVKPDSAKALAMLKQLAEDNYRPAKQELAKAYKTGRFGLAKDNAKYLFWMDRTDGKDNKQKVLNNEY